MHSLQRKLLLYIIVIGLVPILFFTVYYCDFLKTDEYNKLEAESVAVLEKLDSKMNLNINRIQNIADLLFSDEELSSILANSNENPSQLTQEKLDEIFHSFSRAKSELVSIILFSSDGGVYVSGTMKEDISPRDLIFKYNNGGIDAGTLTWLGVKDETYLYDDDIVIAGTIIRDESYLKNEKYLATVYLVFDDSIFVENMPKDFIIAEQTVDGGKETEEETKYTRNNECYSIYDDEFNLIYAVGSRKLKNSFLSYDKHKVVEAGSGSKSFTITVDNEQFIVFSRKSSVLNWDFVRTIPYVEYAQRSQKVIRWLYICILVLVLLWIYGNYFVVKKMMRPISELLYAMKHTASKNFDIKIKRRPRDEFNIVIDGFNDMINQIKSLLEQVVSGEKAKREQDILLLRYQMNPHFLYNTIAAIRVSSMMNNDEKTASMLTVLGRFLRNAILTSDKFVCIKDEIKNIKDYISLYQIRYSEQIDLDIEVDKNCYDIKIPSMLCQPIIENSFVHGLSEKVALGENVTIKVKIEKEDDLIISIYDNGCGIPKDKLAELFNSSMPSDADGSLHIGLNNVQERIHLLFGCEYGLSVESEEGKYTLVKITLPKKTPETYLIEDADRNE